MSTMTIHKRRARRERRVEPATTVRAREENTWTPRSVTVIALYPTANLIPRGRSTLRSNEPSAIYEDSSRMEVTGTFDPRAMRHSRESRRGGCVRASVHPGHRIAGQPTHVCGKMLLKFLPRTETVTAMPSRSFSLPPSLSLARRGSVSEASRISCVGRASEKCELHQSPGDPVHR